MFHSLQPGFDEITLLHLCSCCPCGLLGTRHDFPPVGACAWPVADWAASRCQRFRHPPRGPQLPLPGAGNGRLRGGPGTAAPAGPVLPWRQRRGDALFLRGGWWLTAAVLGPLIWIDWWPGSCFVYQPACAELCLWDQDWIRGTGSWLIHLSWKAWGNNTDGPLEEIHV